MRIGIIGAMDEEIALLLENITNQKRETIAHTLFVQGKLSGKEVVLLKSGIGKVNAAMATTIMHERYAPSHVINTGSAGGLDENQLVGDIVISSEVVHHDVDATIFEYKYGQVPGMPETFASDEDLVEKVMNEVRKIGLNFSKGLIATGDSFIETPKSVALIKKQLPDVIAAEMEAAAIAQVCHQYSKPFVVIRALSDIAGEESSISFDAFLSKASKHAAELILNVIQKM